MDLNKNFCDASASIQTFVKGMPARHKLLPTGGVVLTTEEKYMALVDQSFPDANSKDCCIAKA